MAKSEADLVSAADELMTDLLAQAKEPERRNESDFRLQVMQAAVKWIGAKKGLGGDEPEHSFDRFRAVTGAGANSRDHATSEKGRSGPFRARPARSPRPRSSAADA